MTLMLQDAAVHTQQADKQQKKAEGRAASRLSAHIERLVRCVNHDAPAASDEATPELISSMTFEGLKKCPLLPSRPDKSEFLSIFSSFMCLSTESQDVIMRHRGIQKAFASLCLGDNANAAAMRHLDGTWAHFMAAQETPAVPRMVQDPHK